MVVRSLRSHSRSLTRGGTSLGRKKRQASQVEPPKESGEPAIDNVSLKDLIGDTNQSVTAESEKSITEESKKEIIPTEVEQSAIQQEPVEKVEEKPQVISTPVFQEDRRQHRRSFDGVVDDRMIPDAGVPTEKVTGVLDTRPEGHGLLRPQFAPSSNDVYISSSQIRRFGLKPGDMVEGPARRPKENEGCWGLLKVEKVNGYPVGEMGRRANFDSLTPIFPQETLVLETGNDPFSTGFIDLVAPIGKGQRGMIVSPPKAGKTTILKDIALGGETNYKEVHLMGVLIGERPEEVTDIRRHIEKVTGGKGEVAASNFDEPAEQQTNIAEMALDRAKRLVEMGRDGEIILY